MFCDTDIIDVINVDYFPEGASFHAEPGGEEIAEKVTEALNSGAQCALRFTEYAGRKPVEPARHPGQGLVRGKGEDAPVPVHAHIQRLFIVDELRHGKHG